MVWFPAHLYFCHPYTGFLFFFPFQHTHLSLGLSSKSPLWQHGTISAQLARCWDRVNRRLQPENLTTISYAISSTHHNKVFHWDYTALHNALQGQLPQPEPGVKGSPSQKSHTAGSLWCIPPRTDQATITCRTSCLWWNAVFLALGYVEFQTKVGQTCDRLSQSERERVRDLLGESALPQTHLSLRADPSLLPGATSEVSNSPSDSNRIKLTMCVSPSLSPVWTLPIASCNCPALPKHKWPPQILPELFPLGHAGWAAVPCAGSSLQRSTPAGSHTSFKSRLLQLRPDRLEGHWAGNLVLLMHGGGDFILE